MAPPLRAKEPSVSYTELSLVEQPAIELLEQLGWTHGDLMGEVPGPANPTGRLSWRETVLPERLRAALAGLTQDTVAERMGTTKSAVSRLESAQKHTPSLATLQRYAQAVGCELQVKLVPAK